MNCIRWIRAAIQSPATNSSIRPFLFAGAGAVDGQRETEAKKEGCAVLFLFARCIHLICPSFLCLLFLSLLSINTLHPPSLCPLHCNCHVDPRQLSIALIVSSLLFLSVSLFLFLFAPFVLFTTHITPP